jgi:hypothetical protein
MELSSTGGRRAPPPLSLGGYVLPEAIVKRPRLSDLRLDPLLAVIDATSVSR